MEKRYDVIVVGAGPAGLSAAKTAGENGLDVALLERKTDIPKLSRGCDQTLDSANEYFHEDLFRCNRKGGRVSFPAHGFSVKYDGPFKNLYAVHMYSPNGHKVQSGDLERQREKGDYGVVGIVIDKEILLRDMLEEAQACSIDVFPGINVEKVTSMADGVRVEGNGKSFDGRYLIAADGVNSRIAQMMGFNEGRYFYFNMHSISYYLSGMEVPDPDVVIQMRGFFGEAGVMLSIHPLAGEDGYNVSVSSTDPRVDPNTVFDYMTKRDWCASWFRNARKERTLSATINIYSPVIEPCKGSVLIAGDVGATMAFEITGAMISGWKAGHAVSLALQEKNLELEVTGISRYAKWWKEEYIDSCDQEEYLKVFALPFIFTTEEEMDYILGLIKEPFAPGYNPYTFAHHFGQAWKKVIPIVQKERPELLEKLGRTKLPASQLYSEVTKISKPIS